MQYASAIHATANKIKRGRGLIAMDAQVAGRRSQVTGPRAYLDRKQKGVWTAAR